MTWPESHTSSYGSAHRYAYVHGRHDPYTLALGRGVHPIEVILLEGMVDVRLWDAKRVWYVHKAYRRRAKVLGPFFVRSVGVETASCSASGYEPFVRVYERHGHLPAHYCWATEADAKAHADLLNTRKLR